MSYCFAGQTGTPPVVAYEQPVKVLGMRTSLATGRSRTDGVSALHNRRKKYPTPARPSIKLGLSTSPNPRNRVIAPAACLAR